MSIKDINQLLEMYKRGEDLTPHLQHLSESELKSFKLQAKEALAKARLELYNTERDLRDIRGQIALAQQDYDRVSAVVEQSKLILLNAFDKIFKYPEQAAQAVWGYEKRFGLEQAAQMLRKNPSMFGALKGINLMGIKTTARRIASNVANQLNYATLRYNFDHGSKLLTQIKKVMGA